jgi:hypothetical protein
LNFRPDTKLNGSDAKNATLVEGFIPLYQTPRTVTFSDLRFYDKRGTPLEGNLAFGVRHLTPNSRIFGVYGSVDRFRTATKRYFNQATIGGELWLNRVFFGANGYIPIGTKRYDDDAQNLAILTPIGGNSYNILYFPGYERILPGVDALLGYDFTNNFRIFAGGYYFYQSDVGSMSGPKLRANYTWYSTPHHRLFGVFDRIALEAQVTHDHIRQTDWYAGIRFSVNLGKNPPHRLTRLEQHLNDTIRRDMNGIDVEYHDPQSHLLRNTDGSKVVVFQPTTYAEFANALDTTLKQVPVANLAATSTPDIIGVEKTLTAESSDDQSLTITRDVEVNGGAHDFIVDGRPYAVSVGSNGEVDIDTSDTFMTLSGSSNLTLANMTFFNSATDAGTMLSLPDSYTGDTTISNTIFHTRSASDPIITLEGSVAPMFDDTTLRNTNSNSSAFLLDVATDETIVIDEGEITLDNSGTGGGIEVSGGTLRIENETIVENIGEPVIDLVPGSKSLIIINSTITNNGAGCIVKEENKAKDAITITDSTLVANGANATLDFGGEDNTIAITNTSISNTGTGDLIYHTGTATLDFSGTLTLNHPVGDGIVLASTTAQTQSLSNFTITGAISGGKVFSLPSTSLESLNIQNATITNSGSGDLIYHANDTTLTLGNLTLNQTGSGNGIVLASTTTRTQTFTTTIGGNIQSGALIRLPSSSEETLLLSGATLTNSGAGNILSWASSTDVTINNGASLANTGTGNAVSVAGGTGSLTINGTSGTVTLNAADGFALTTNGHDFGPIDIEYVQSNAPFDFELTHASATGSSLSFTNNTLDLSSNPPPANTQGAKAVLSFVALYGDLVVDDLDNNTITVTDPSNTISGDLYGVYTAVNKTNTPTITFTNSIQNNNITLEDISADMTTYGFYFHDLSGTAHSSANITLSDSLDNNTISIDNKYGARAFSNDANLSITNDIINNNWTVQDSTLSTGITTTNYGLYNAGILTLVSGNFNANTITIQNHAGAANAFGNIGTSAEFTLSTGNFGASGAGNSLSSLNPTTTHNNGIARGLLNTGTMTIAGNFNHNTVLSQTNIASSARNQGLRNDKSLTINGNMNDNTFEADASGGARLTQPFLGGGTNSAFFLLEGDFNNNDIIGFAQKGGVNGIFMTGRYNFSNNFNNNTFTLESDGFYLGSSGVTALELGGESAGSSFGSDITNTIDGNAFSVIRTSDPAREIALRINGNASVTFYNIQDNNFSDLGTTTTLKITIPLSRTSTKKMNIYGASGANDLVTNNTGLTLDNINDVGVNYFAS